MSDTVDRPPPARELPRMKAPGPSVQQLLDAETVEVPAALRDSSAVDLGDALIPKERYTSRAFEELEMTRLWPRVWQMACREEDILAVGDHEIYEIGDTSLIVARVTTDEIRAYHNVCLHRGRILRDTGGFVSAFRCPFHGFTWNLDGTVRKLTNEWDFPHVDPQKFCLPQAKVARWNGFVFVNLAADPEPFEDYLENMPEVFATRGWSLAERVKTVYTSKIHPCNWKVLQEAFIESFHVVATHPGAMPFLGDAFTQYDVWPGRRHTRMISPRGMASPHLAGLSDEQVFQAGVKGVARRGANGDEPLPRLPLGTTPRRAMGDIRRQVLAETLGVESGALTDCEVLDTIQYHIFPNLVCWAGWGSFIVYRFRPNGRDPDTSIMDVMLLTPRPEGAGLTPAREPQRLTVDESHQSAPQLGGLAAVFDEDSSNLGQIQKGLKAMRAPGLTLGRYQEMRIRNFHRALDTYLEP